MSNGHDPNKTPPPPPADPSGPGGAKPQDVDKPPQIRKAAGIGGAIGGVIGGLIGALIGCCLHQLH